MTNPAAENITTARSPPTWSTRSKQYRAELIETAVEMDDEVDGKPTSMAKSRTWTRSSAASARAPIDLTFFPTYCGSSFKNKGVQNVLDAVVDYLPSPLEVEAPKPEVDLEGNDGRFRHRR